MNAFPNTIRPQRRNNFSKLLENYHIQQLRYEIYQFIIRGNQEDYFEFDSFKDKYLLSSTKQVADLWLKLSPELEEKGWKTAFAFGNTGCYIYYDTIPAHLQDLQETHGTLLTSLEF